MQTLKLGNLTIGSGGGKRPNGSPSSLVATVLSDTSIKCDWTNGATNQDGTYVYTSLDGVTNWTLSGIALGSLTTKTLTGLTENTTYYIKVVHYKGSKLSDYTTIVSKSTLTIEAVTIYNSASHPIDSTILPLNKMIASLRQEGMWDDYVAMQVYAIDNSALSLLSLKGNDPELISTPLFTQNNGYTSSASKGINTKFNPVRDGNSKYVKNNYAWGIYSRTDSQVANRDAGHANATTGSFLRLKNSSNSCGFIAYRNDLSTDSVTIVDSRGLFVIDKSSDNRVDLYRNGVSIKSNTIAGGNLVDNEMYVCFYNNNGTIGSATNREYGLFLARKSFNAFKNEKEFMIIETYMAEIGAGFFFNLRLNSDTLLNYNTLL